MIDYQLENHEGMKHAEVLAPFVEQCMERVCRNEDKLDAVAVSIGPGSYTGLRIGLSLAKGLAFSLDIPLIGISTLKIMAVKAMFRGMAWKGDELLVPMIDARRMEVFTAVYDFRLDEVVTSGPLIVDESSFATLLTDRNLYFMGDGSEKCQSVIVSENAHWLKNINPLAKDMMALSEKAFRENDFIDIAYSVPEYLKDYHTTVARPKI